MSVEKGDDDVRNGRIQWCRRERYVSVCTYNHCIETGCAGVVYRHSARVLSYVTAGAVSCMSQLAMGDVGEYAASKCGSPGLVGRRTDLR
jgi:hypothetical protein